MSEKLRLGPRSGDRARARAWLALGATLVVTAVLGTIGLGVENRLDPASLSISGTTSAHGEALLHEHFGDSSPFAILLRGPAAAIDHQGPSLVRALRRGPEATTISPWDRGGVAGLRPRPRQALILVDFHVPIAVAVRDTVPAVERKLREHIHAPLKASQSGYATISRALQDESSSATERAELLAVPLLAIVLLAVFRSVVAAAIPFALGTLTVLAGRGVLVLLSGVMEMDALSLVVCTMMGLALGVDYSLLIVSRFREELARDRDPTEAAARTRASAGRTVVFAGATLFLSIFASAFVQPGGLFVSFATALVVVTCISIVIATTGLPALLAILGEKVNAGQIGRTNPAVASSVVKVATIALRRPAFSVLLVSVPLILLAAPALALSTGPPGVDELPDGNPVREAAETIDATVGPGWEAPFVLTAAARGPIATASRLELLEREQRRISSQPGVRAVVGPAAIARRAGSLRDFGRRLTAQSSERDLARLGPGLHRAAGGVEHLRAGVARAAAGSALLGEGSERAGEGAERLAGALARAAAGGREADGATRRLAGGAKRLARGQRKAAVGSLALTLGLSSLAPRVGATLARARQLADSLQQRAKADPSFQAEANRAAIVVSGLASSRGEAQRLGGVARSLNRALNRLAVGSRRLRDGTGRLARAASGLGGNLETLGDGAARLARGLKALQGGAGALHSGLSDGFHRSYPLQARLANAAVHISTSVDPLRRGARELRRNSPHLFSSGYFVLSALDGATAERRARSGEAIALADGGQAARLLVVPSSAFNTPGSRDTERMLLDEADRLGSQGGLTTGVSGGAATLNDYGRATRARLPLVIATVVTVTLLMLIAILRAPLLALLTLALNLFSVAAAIGIISLVCQVPAGYPLGGHPYIDTVGAAAIFGVTFGLSIDYAVFLLARMRERWEETGDNADAIAFGLEKTAGVVTGAAAIMAAVFISFATAPVATVSQMGVGLAVAVLLDATVVRIVLLPAFMLLAGERIWHVPATLDRLLPNLNVHGRRGGGEARA